MSIENDLKSLIEDEGQVEEIMQKYVKDGKLVSGLTVYGLVHIIGLDFPTARKVIELRDKK